MAGKKIVDLPPLGRDLASTDLLELSLAGGTGSRKITGQEIMNTSKLNIGTTAITSGTVGRVLFEGTGNVVQESANLFWDNTNGRLGIGTSSPLSPLDVVTSAVTIYPRLRTTSTASNTDVGLRFQDGTTGTGNSDGLYVGRASSLNYLWTYEAEPLLFGTNNAERMRLFSTGNVAINTTTDAGYKLDVNGTARVGATDGVSGFQITAPTRAWYFTTSQQGGTFNAISAAANGASGSGNYGFVIGGGWAFNIGLTTSQPNSFFSVYPSATNNGEVRIGGQTGNASSLLTLESTTKGFLPPRMTTTQKNAIATPAAGLVVYDTTLNKLCVRTASAWETITSI